MKLYGTDNNELLNVSSLTRDGNDLLIKGKILGAMPLTAKLTPDQARAALKMLDWRTLLFLLTLAFRRGKS